MSKRGPKPKPTHLKVLNGNPGRRPLNEDEPKPTQGIPSAPEWLSGSAKDKWDELSIELDKLGLLTLVDGMALALACKHYAIAVEALELLNEHGLLIEGYRGDPKKNPAAQIFKDNSASYVSYMKEFGLSPSSRTGLKIPRSHEEANKGIRKYIGKGRNDK